MFEGFPDEHREFFAAVAGDTTWDVVQARAEQHERAVAGRRLGSGAWLGTREPVERVREEWRRLRPLVEWLAEHVGPRSRRR